MNSLFVCLFVYLFALHVRLFVLVFFFKQNQNYVSWSSLEL